MTKLFTDDDNSDEPIIEIPTDAPLSPFLEKYKDEAGVAKAIVEKDTFIARLQRENAQFRASQVNDTNVAEIVDRLLAQRNTIPNPPVDTSLAGQPNEPTQPTSQGISLEDVEKLLDKKAQTVKAEQNANYVRAELEKQLGSNWQQEVRKKAKEMGESAEFMDTLAQTKPTVLLKLFETPASPAQRPTLFNSTVNTTASALQQQPTQRTMRYYQALKAKDLVQYNSPQVQNQMHKDALQLREAFFDT